MEKTSHKCVVCGHNEQERAPYRSNKFNNKLFNYYKCGHCETINIFPFPDHGNMSLVYREEDHSYLNKVNEFKPSLSYPKYDYKWCQLKISCRRTILANAS